MRWTLLLLLTLCRSLVVADDLGDPAGFSAASRLKSIEAEIESLGQHAWAGAYSDGRDGAFTGSLQLWVAPKSGAASKQRDCMSDDTEFGSIPISGSVLQIDWNRQSRTGLSPTEREMLVIPFQQHLYLVPKNGIHPFCIAARTNGRQPIGVLRSIKKRDMPDPTKPQLPDEFKKYLDLPPIQANIVAVEKQNRTKLARDEELITQRVVLDAGVDDHVFVGMRFEDTEGNPPYHVVTIVDVQREQSTALSRYYVETGDDIRWIRKRWVFKTASW